MRVPREALRLRNNYVFEIRLYVARCSPQGASVFILIRVVSALRVYAVSNRNRVPSGLTLLPALVQVAVNVVGERPLLL